MTEPHPPERKRTLNYAPPPLRSNGGFVGRMAIGAALGVIGIVLGGISAGTIGDGNNAVIYFFIPPVLALVAAIALGLSQRKYGYVTGVIVAPFVIAAVGMVLLMIICGGATIFRL